MTMSNGAMIGLGIYVALSLLIGGLTVKDWYAQERTAWAKAGTARRCRLACEGAGFTLVMLLFWPVVLAWILVQEFAPSWLSRVFTPDSHMPDQVFAVLPEHLGASVDVAVVEVANHITDPLEAVPYLPFGHLHARWLQLRSHLVPGCTLHAFEVPFRVRPSDPLRHHRGWAVAGADGVVLSYWVAEVEVVNDPV